MSGTLLLWIALAIATFWTVGLYNRLIRMRQLAVAALLSVEKHLRQYAAVLDAHLHSIGLSHPLGKRASGSELPNRWLQLSQALVSLDVALKDARRMPLSAPSVARVAVELAVLQNAWSHLCATPSDLAGPVVPDTMRLQWDAVSSGVGTARSGFNRILAQYNDAIGQYPARLVVGVMRFEATRLL